MTLRDGRCCPLCGYPIPDPSVDLCDQCAEWQDVAREAEAAIDAAEAA